MKYALVEGRRHEAEPSLSGRCPACDSWMIAKCGERRIRHWAHRGKQHCDHWWEPETLWHRNWKNKFPPEWQEIRHLAHNGERHIADVKTPHGCVIEFQHSHLRPEERRSREAFYKPMIWIVNGLRRKRDRASFNKGRVRIIRLAPLTLRTRTEQSALLQEWIDCEAPVFFDFGIAPEDIASFGTAVLWCLSPRSTNGVALLSPVMLGKFIHSLREGEPIKGISLELTGRRDKPLRFPGQRTNNSPYALPRYGATKGQARGRF